MIVIALQRKEKRMLRRVLFSDSYRNFPRVLLVFLAIFALACGAGKQGPRLSDSEVSKILQERWGENYNFVIYLGTLEVVRDSGSFSPGRIYRAQLPSYRAWESAGLVKITTKQDLTGRFSGWDNWNRLFLQGVESVIQVSPTEKGVRFKKEKGEGGQGAEHLLIPQGSFQVEEVIKMEPIRLGVDDYQVAWGTHVANYNPEFLAYCEKLKIKLEKERKFRVLLKFDPFTSKWEVVADEIGDRGKPMEAGEIDKILKEWKI